MLIFLRSNEMIAPRIAESLPKPMRSPFARFFPTDTCAVPIHAAISEYINEVKHHVIYYDS